MSEVMEFDDLPEMGAAAPISTMMSAQHTVAGVDVGWMESVVPGIEELAASLPEPARPCGVCNGTGWIRLVREDGSYPMAEIVARCFCWAETGGEG